MAGYGVFGWGVFIGFTAILLLIGIMAERKGVKSDAEYWAANRSLGPLVIAMTIIASAYSGWAMVGSPGIFYAYGWIEAIGGLMWIFPSIWFTLYLGKRLRAQTEAMGSLTIPSYMGIAHNSRLLQFGGAFFTIAMYLVMIVSQLKATAVTYAPVLGVDFSVAAIIFAVVMIVVVGLGGMRGAAWVNAFMMVVMLTVAAATIYAFAQIGWFEGMHTKLLDMGLSANINPTGTPYFPAGMSWQVLIILPYVTFWYMNPHVSEPFFSISKAGMARKVAIYMIFLQFPLTLIVFAGGIARILLPALTDPDTALPLLMQTALPYWVFPFIAIGISFAMLTTVVCVLVVSGAAVAYDMRTAIWPKKQISGRMTVWISRLTIGAIIVIATIWCIGSPPPFLVFFAVLSTGALMACVAGPALISLFWKKGTRTGAIVSMLGGFISTMYLTIGPPNIGWYTGPVAGCAIGVVLYFVISLLAAKMGEKQVFEILETFKAAKKTAS